MHQILPVGWHLCLVVFASEQLLAITVSPEDVLSTKVWLDRHVFNMTLKTTKSPSGQVWMMDEEKARQRHLQVWPPSSLPTLCFLGLGSASLEYLVSLAQFFPELQLIVVDAQDERWFGEFKRLFAGGHQGIERGRIEDFAAVNPKRRSCQAITWSVDTPAFSFYRYRELLYSAPNVLALFNMQGCVAESRDDDANRHYCSYLQHSYQMTLCGRVKADKTLSYTGDEELFFPLVDTECGEQICMCHASADALLDADFNQLCRSGHPHTFAAQWGQDEFFVQNLFPMDRWKGGGFYVDVGASHAFHLSNTAYFDLCMGWHGICIEPNPWSVPSLRGLRSCEVVNACVWRDDAKMRFTNRGELTAALSDDFSLNESCRSAHSCFEARCAPLQHLLQAAIPAAVGGGFSGWPTIDVLSVDAEGAEVEIFRNFPFSDWNIRTLVVETSRRTAMAVDSLLLPQGFLKVAVLGKDAIYVHRSSIPMLASELKLPGHIKWNPPGTDSEFVEYGHFQRLFGVDGDLDADIGDQRDDVELARQWDRLVNSTKEKNSELVERARHVTIGGILSESQRRAMELPWVQESFKDGDVKDALQLLAQDEMEFVRRVRSNNRLLFQISRLVNVGVLTDKLAIALTNSVDVG